MKASEMINSLHDLMEKHGDLDVAVSNGFNLSNKLHTNICILTKKDYFKDYGETVSQFIDRPNIDNLFIIDEKI